MEWKKVLATIIVSAFFIFFWINGPLQIKEVLAHLEQEETEFSKPKIIGKSSKIKNYGEIEDAETKGEGWSLITKESNKIKDKSKLIFSSKNNILFSKSYSKKLLSHAKRIFGKNIITEVKPTENLVYIKINKNEKNYFYTESGGVINNIRGYGGSINIGLLVNDNGLIEKVQHVSSKETESYLQKIAKTNYYKSFQNLPIEDDHIIDAISGATLTTKAIAQTTTELVDIIGDSYSDYLLNDRNTPSFKVQAKNTLWWIMHIIIIGILFLYGFQKKYKKSKHSIQILSIVSVLYIGFFMNNSFTYVSFLHPFLGTSVSSLVAFYALFTLLGAIWGKNTYCKYVCPFGHAQRLSLQLSKNRFSSKFFIKNKYVKLIRGTITIVLITGILLGLRSWGNFEIFPDFFGFDFMSTWFFISVLLVLVNLKYPFIWCRISCPTGSVLDTISKVTKR